MAEHTTMHPSLTAAVLGSVALTAALPMLLGPAAGASAPAIANASGTYQFETLGDPADPTFNQLLGINDFGVIAGYFGSGMPPTMHPNKGYTLHPYSGLTFANENFPGSAQTQVVGINDFGTTAGFWVNAAGANYGFVDRAGVFTSVTDPHTTASPTFNQLLAINDLGIAVGFYNDAAGNSHGYEYNRGTGVFTALNPPGATTATAAGINDNGTVCGFATLRNGHSVGWVLRGGAYFEFSVPGATATQATGINNSGEVVGNYTKPDKSVHGFTFEGPTFRTVDDPNGVGSTVVNGVNNSGDLVGFYTDASGNTDGLLALPRPAGTPGS